MLTQYVPKTFDPEVADAMGAAFDAAWAEVLRSKNVTVNGDADSIREGLALRIIEAAQRGERDIIRLRDDAIAALTVIPPRPERTVKYTGC